MYYISAYDQKFLIGIQITVSKIFLLSQLQLETVVLVKAISHPY